MLSELLGTIRRAGVRVSTSEAIDLARAVERVGVSDRRDLFLAIHSVLCKESRDRERVERALEAYFRAEGESHADLYQRLLARGFSAKEVDFLRETLSASARSDAALGVVGAIAQGPLAMDRLIELAGERIPLRGARDAARTGFLTMRLLEAARVPRAETELSALRSRLRDALGECGDVLSEVLRDELAAFRSRARSYVTEQLTTDRRDEGLEHVPFAQLDRDEVEAVERAVRELAERLVGRALVRSRHAQRGALDARATLRRALQTGGVPFEAKRRGKRPRKPRLVLLCDVSDSVKTSARFMLLFVHAVQRIFEDARSFVFVSELAEATQAFKRESPARAVEMAYGGSLVRVSDNSHYGRVWRRMRERHEDALDARTTLVILGDARTNHFDPGEQAFAELAARVQRVVWLSPEPESAWSSGDSALRVYARHADEVLPVYDLTSLKVAARTLARG